MILTKKKIPQNDDLFRPDLSLNNNLSIPGKNYNSEDDNLQLQTIHEGYSSVIKQ